MIKHSLFIRNILSSNFQKFINLKKNGSRSFTHQTISQSSVTQTSTQPNAVESTQPIVVDSTLLSEEEAYSKSLQHPDFFNVADLFTVEDLFNANVHLGHKDGSLCNHMRPYIFGSRLGHLIIDLDQTATLLRDALNFAAHIAFRSGIILFVCKGAQHQLLVEKTAAECKEYSHTRVWQTGCFTNSTAYYGSVTRLPDLLIFLNTMYDVRSQHLAVKDAAKMLIPAIGIVDTNCDPRLITYPVPGNDDTPSAMNLYCKLFQTAILRGKLKRKELITG